MPDFDHRPQADHEQGGFRCKERYTDHMYMYVHTYSEQLAAVYNTASSATAGVLAVVAFATHTRETDSSCKAPRSNLPTINSTYLGIREVVVRPGLRLEARQFVMPLLPALPALG